MRLKDKVAVVTGAGSGIGRGIALRFAEEGAKVVVDDIIPQRAIETVAMITEQGGEAIPVHADISERSHVQKMFQAALDRYGGYHILVNNAGILTWAPFLELKDDDWERVLAVNLRGVFLCTQEAARYWVGRAQPGKVVNIGSVNSELALPELAHYVASKGGVKMLTRAMALDLGKHRINVNAIGPGLIPTRIGGGDPDDPERLRRRGRLTPLGRHGWPRDMANLALFLVSEEADYVTGQLLMADGGWTIGLSTNPPPEAPSGQ